MLLYHIWYTHTHLTVHVPEKHVRCEHANIIQAHRGQVYSAGLSVACCVGVLWVGALCGFGVVYSVMVMVAVSVVDVTNE